MMQAKYNIPRATGERLFKVYPTDSDVLRDIDCSLWEEIETNFEKAKPAGLPRSACMAVRRSSPQGSESIEPPRANA